MAGTITIKDSGTTKFIFKTVTSIRHEWFVSIEKIEIPGEEEISADHNKPVIHTILVEFELIDRSGEGSTGSLGQGTIWEQRTALALLRKQSSNLEYYNLTEEDSSENWIGLIEKIVTNRAIGTQAKMTGSLVFVHTSTDVINI